MHDKPVLVLIGPEGYLQVDLLVGETLQSREIGEPQDGPHTPFLLLRLSTLAMRTPRQPNHAP